MNRGAKLNCGWPCALLGRCWAGRVRRPLWQECGTRAGFRITSSVEADVVAFYERCTGDLLACLQVLTNSFLVRLVVYDRSVQSQSQQGTGDSIQKSFPIRLGQREGSYVVLLRQDRPIDLKRGLAILLRRIVFNSPSNRLSPRDSM